VLAVGAEVLGGARELAAEDGLAGGQAVEDVPLEHVVEPLALGDHADPSLEGRLGHPSHRSASIAVRLAISGTNRRN
jgi:hypothetical protein